jgi:predicted Fe-S protein YdhL (DUF1289 family)
MNAANSRAPAAFGTVAIHRRTQYALSAESFAVTDSPFMTVHSRIDIETPCVKVCVLDPESGYCIGCGRTRNEIAGWLDMTDQLRRDIIAGLPQRVDSLTRAKRRRGGARARRGEGL